VCDRIGHTGDGEFDVTAEGLSRLAGGLFWIGVRGEGVMMRRGIPASRAIAPAWRAVRCCDPVLWLRSVCDASHNATSIPSPRERNDHSGPVSAEYASEAPRASSMRTASVGTPWSVMANRIMSASTLIVSPAASSRVVNGGATPPRTAPAAFRVPEVA